MSYERMTPCGQIAGCGCQWPGVAAYKGIRYATAGRWEYPRPVTHWDGVYQATAYGAACFQPRRENKMKVFNAWNVTGT